MLLTDREIQIALQQGLFSIKPSLHENAYSSTAVDLRLHPTISEFIKPPAGTEVTIDPTHKDFNHEEAIKSHTRQLTIEDVGYVFQPGSFLLAWTVEYVALNINARIAARVEGKSSLARLGIGVHVTAPIIHAGFAGQIRLEMTNHGTLPVRLKPNMRICQLCIEQTLGTPESGYRGRFAEQTVARRG